MTDLDSALETGKDAFAREDYRLALVLLLPCAEAGITEAEAAVGSIYMLGLGTPRDAEKAIIFLTRAAEKGSGNAAHNLGTLYLTGEPDIPRNPEESRKWYRKAHDLGFIVTNEDWYRRIQE